MTPARDLGGNLTRQIIALLGLGKSDDDADLGERAYARKGGTRIEKSGPRLAVRRPLLRVAARARELTGGWATFAELSIVFGLVVSTP
jgi:hypothetical protein